MERREFKSAWRVNKDRAGGERGGRAREREESGGRRGREQGESESKRQRVCVRQGDAQAVEGFVAAAVSAWQVRSVEDADDLAPIAGA